MLRKRADTRPLEAKEETKDSDSPAKVIAAPELAEKEANGVPWWREQALAAAQQRALAKKAATGASREGAEASPAARSGKPEPEPAASLNTVQESVVPEAAAEPEKPLAAGASSNDSRPSSHGVIRLKKKTESAVESRRDATLQALDKPVCCNCRVPFTVESGVPLLMRIECPRCGTRQIVPARIENFILESQLGSGGMGMTYRAFDESLHRNVAIKLISGELAGSRGNVEAMVREARRAAGLTHPHIVPIYSIGSVDGTPYIVMELLSDALLSRPVMKGRRLEERFVLETGLAVARALQAASGLWLLHLDIKPGNILHDRFGVAKLIDFGLACHLDEDVSKGLGTCLYMPPERLKRTGQDMRSDQYSLGLTMWEALAGRPPFQAPTRDELASIIVKTVPDLIHEIRTDLHLWTAGLIHKMISYEPHDRYQTLDELIGAFQVVLQALGERDAATSARTNTSAS